MNVMLSNLSHDLDVSLAYSIDREGVGDRTGFSCPCIRSGLDATTSTLAAGFPMRSGSPFVIRRAMRRPNGPSWRAR
jgi:hypothetical protein